MAPTSSFWQDFCCCFKPSSSEDDIGYHHNNNSINNNNIDSEINIYGNTVNSLNSITGGGQQQTGNSGILSGFYRTRQKTPRDMVKSIKYQLNRLDASQNSKDSTKIASELSKPISALKTLTIQSEEDVQRGDYDLQMFLIKEIYENNLFEILVQEIEKFPFEARKDAVIIFNSLLRRQIPPNRQIVAENLRDNRGNLLKDLLNGYDRPERTLHYGLMLRECIKFEFLAEIVLNLPEFEKLFDYIQLPTFDVSSDVFALIIQTLKGATLSGQMIPCSSWLDSIIAATNLETPIPYEPISG